MSIKEIFRTKASEIIKDSIKTAVYIDEKAWDPFSGEKYDPSIHEHEISRDLNKNFKQQGINLCIHKFNKGEELLSLDNPLKGYLFKDIDIVLLDWDLDDDKLNKPALRLLSDIIKQSHIHFCCVYSSSPNFEEIIKKICAFFSGISEEQYNQLRDLIESEDDLLRIVQDLDITEKNSNKIQNIIKLEGGKEILEKAKRIIGKGNDYLPNSFAIAINKNLAKSDETKDYDFEIVSKIGNEFSIVIDNTIISILFKKDNLPASFINSFTNHVQYGKEKSFLQLIGLNMQNEFAKKGSFVNTGILDINIDAFLYHRRQMEKDGNNSSFEEFMKTVLLKNAEHNLNNSKLAILDDDFLISIDENNEVSESQKAQINTFYNGSFLFNKKQLNFGDIFKDKNNTYYLCITALCDCLHPENIKNDFFFATSSEKINLNKAFDLGDSGYISYISKNECISWSPDVYIKPKQFHVSNPHIEDSKLKLNQWENGNPIEIDIEYIFSLKQSYAQRIANHAFTHPVRVGVDFVKK